jgi:hypothetical protein
MSSLKVRCHRKDWWSSLFPSCYSNWNRWRSRQIFSSSDIIWSYRAALIRYCKCFVVRVFNSFDKIFCRSKWMATRSMPSLISVRDSRRWVSPLWSLVSRRIASRFCFDRTLLRLHLEQFLRSFQRLRKLVLIILTDGDSGLLDAKRSQLFLEFLLSRLITLTFNFTFLESMLVFSIWPQFNLWSWITATGRCSWLLNCWKNRCPMPIAPSPWTGTNTVDTIALNPPSLCQNRALEMVRYEMILRENLFN